MTTKTLALVAGIAATLLSASSLMAADATGFPGDKARPGDNGVPPPGYPGSMPNFAIPRSKVPALPIDLAVKAARAIVEGCKEYPLGVAVLNAAGAPTLVYIPDGSEGGHGYTAIRKAYTAISFKVSTSELVSRAQQDPAFAAEIKANPNYIAFRGGVLLKSGDDIIGAIGVSGTPHDEECAQKGLEQLKGQMK